MHAFRPAYPDVNLCGCGRRKSAAVHPHDFEASAVAHRLLATGQRVRCLVCSESGKFVHGRWHHA